MQKLWIVDLPTEKSSVISVMEFLETDKEQNTYVDYFSYLIS